MKKDALFYLVKSLSRSEKRYFKRFAGLNGNGDKNYLDLFEFLDGQKEPSDHKMRHHFKDQAFARQFHVMKNYLQSMIMRSLRGYHETKSKSSEMKVLLREAELYMEKELFDHANSVIDKTIAMAEKYERFEAIVEANRLRRTILQTTRGLIKARDDIKLTIKREKEAIEEMRVINQLQDLNYSFMDLDFEQNETPGHPGTLAMRDIPKSLQGMIHYYHIQYVSKTFSGNASDGVKYLDQLIAIIEDHPHRIQEDPTSYITVLNNKIGALLYAREVGQIPDLLNKIRRIPETYNIPRNRLTLKTFLSTYNVELELYRDTAQWTKGIELINEINSFIKDHSSDISLERKLTFNYQFAYIYFLAGDFTSTLRYLNEIAAGQYSDIRLDIITYARYLNLIVHFELRNIIVLRYAVTSTRRFLQKRRQLKSSEKILLKFFSKISTSPQSSWSQYFEWLQNNLFAKVSEEEKANMLDYIDFNTWIENNLKPIRRKVLDKTA